MRTYDKIGVQVPQVYLPNKNIDPMKWAVVACDQYTSQTEYWQQVKQLVGGDPSTLHLILPEIFLGTAEEEARTQCVHLIMQEYLQNGVLEPYEGLIYIERTVDGKCRRGLMLALDLEQYDFRSGTQSLIRPTEGTIVERIKPRVRIREKAPLELSHILVLIDDPERTVIEPVAEQVDRGDALIPRYDFDLMMGGGHLTGYQVIDQQVETSVMQALAALADPQAFHQKYGVGPEKDVLLFAMGDGNHSLATAKTIWEQLKPQVGMDHPARYALVEIENVHDEGLKFEPIHRVLFDLKKDILPALQSFYGGSFRFIPTGDVDEMIATVETWCGSRQVFGYVSGEQAGIVEIENPDCNLSVGTLQNFLDGFLKDGLAGRIDYVHGAEVVSKLGSRPGNAGFFLPCMDKHDLFRTVILDGALPRKTFSMGEAHEKRFYMESRKIR